MHDIEPYHKWRHQYIASEDELSPFYGRLYDEFKYSQKIYNYFIHPQWDSMGSPTLYTKVLYVDYNLSFAIIELIGEWNDCINNDIMFLKRELIDNMLPNGIVKYMILCDHVLNFHSDDDSYYEEWWDDVKDESGWIYFINTRHHIEEEMNQVRLNNYVQYGDDWNDMNWRTNSPKNLFLLLDKYSN